MKKIERRRMGRGEKEENKKEERLGENEENKKKKEGERREGRE